MVADDDRLLAVGLSHHTAPLEIRERLAMDEDAVRSTLERLVRTEGLAEEALLLSTCNRVELYAVPRSLPGLHEFFGEYRGPHGERLDAYLYWLEGREAVRHLFRVASSLDSLVVGEPQILGQVRDAVRIATESSTLGRILVPLSQRTLTVAKKVRTTTEIGKSTVGVGNAGVDLALQIFGSLEGKRAMLVGVGEMGRQVARALVSAGLDELLVTNRTFERSVELAAEHGATPVPYERLPEYLARADIIVAATAAQQPVVSVAMVRQALRDRRYKTLFLIDLSVPRSIEPAVDDLEDAYLFNVDDLQHVVDSGRRAREEAAAQALALVNDEAERFLESLREIDARDDLRMVNDAVERIRVLELDRSKKLVQSLDETQREQLEALTRALVRKLLHKPTTAIRTAAREGDSDKVKALAELWKGDE